MIKVLIVDDEYIMRQGLKYMIHWEKEGYELVGEASNGSEALKLLELHRPHIVICDIVMPLLNGVDFTEAVHKMYPQIQMIILSGYDKFEYVKHTLLNGAVDYILKPTLNPQELLRVLGKAAEGLPGYVLARAREGKGYERMLERCLLGHDRVPDASAFAKVFTGSCFRLYAQNIHLKNEKGQDMSELLLKKMERELEKIEDVQKMVVTVREGIICVVFCCEPSESRKLLGQLYALSERLACLCPSVFGVVSRPFGSLESLYERYRQDIAGNVDRAFYYEGTKLLVLEGQAEEPEKSVEKFDFFRYSQLLNARQYAEAAQMLRQYNLLALEAFMDIFRLKNQMKNMIYQFLDLLQLSAQEQEEYREDFFAEINSAAYREEYLCCLEEILERLLELSGQSQSPGDKRMDKMLSYIAANYQEDLRLEDLAQEFNFNYHYLSAYFRSRMKEGFSDYLNRLRIEKACELLEDASLSIAQISSLVGYSEHSYFCRVFKKITGETPSVFRRRE